MPILVCAQSKNKKLILLKVLNLYNKSIKIFLYQKKLQLFRAIFKSIDSILVGPRFLFSFLSMIICPQIFENSQVYKWLPIQIFILPAEYGELNSFKTG